MHFILIHCTCVQITGVLLKKVDFCLICNCSDLLMQYIGRTETIGTGIVLTPGLRTRKNSIISPNSNLNSKKYFS